MDAPPVQVREADWRAILAAGHIPMYRGIYGAYALRKAEQFRAGDPFIGWARNVKGSGTNFATDHEFAGMYDGSPTEPSFTPRRRAPRSMVLKGYLHKDAVVLSYEDAQRRREEDIAALPRGNREAIAAALNRDIGLWAALSGIDAIWIRRPDGNSFDRQYLVGNRAAMFVDRAEAATAEPDWSGDGWIDCDCGERHWGHYGAAGLLLTHRAADGTRWVLMQHRSAANQHAGTWGLPGGAREYREPDERAAMRETEEEAGISPDQYRVVGRYVDDHGNWSYSWVHAVANGMPEPTADHESITLEWVPLDKLEDLRLHPGFAASWPQARAALLGDDGPRPNSAGG
jgi:8-oxo-dGTP pyrophosphatase MutT (NUDIX family)